MISQSVQARVLLESHEKETGRCFTRACVHNKEEGCEKPIDKPCPQLWFLTGNTKAGVDVDLRRLWTPDEKASTDCAEERTD